MTEEASVDANTATTRQRKKRKWDQPAESLVSAAVSMPGLLPFSGAAALAGIALPGIFPSLVGVFPTVVPEAPGQISSAASIVQQNAAAIVQKINQDLANKGLLPQVKIQDELIAREIVINDAEPGVRYKLTKRQTQEEIQMKTGAVVITRGRYRPPNGPLDHEKPLYLHISAGAHLKDTAERVKAVDQAAALVEDMLKQGRQQVSGPLQATQLSSGGMALPFTAAVFAGFEADSSLNLISRIRGPNDQYINHIMNETGAIVVLRGKGSNSSEGSVAEELLQPLHLFISADNPKSLDDARRLAENLLETIRSEFVGTRPPYLQPAVSYSSQQPLQSYQVSSYVAPSVVPGSYGGLYPYSLAQLSSQHSPPVLQPGSLTMTLPQPAVATATSLPTASSQSNRLPSSKVYNAVPPPKQLLITDQTTRKNDSESEACESTRVTTESAFIADAESSSQSSSYTMGMSLSSFLPASCTPLSSVAYSAYSVPYGTPAVQHLPSSMGYGQLVAASYPQASQTQQPYPVVTLGSISGYSAYSGIYPQASPLQQVALALQRPPPPVSVKPGSTSTESNAPTKAQRSSSQGQSEKQERQRRKFQEFPVVAKESSTNDDQHVQAVSALPRPDDSSPALEPVEKKQQIMPPPMAMLPPIPRNMPPPPPKNMPSASLTGSGMVSTSTSRNMPPPPSKGMLPPSPLVPKASSALFMEGLAAEGLKLVDYGEEDEDDSGSLADDKKEATLYTNGKPFWAA